MNIGPGGLIYQRHHSWLDPGGFYDFEHAISFNVNLLEGSLYKKTTGFLPPEPAMSEAEYSELNLSYFKTEDDLQLCRQQSPVEDVIRSICDIREIKEASHPIGVVKLELTGPGASRASPYAEMLARARRLNCDTAVESKPVVEWWRLSSPRENGQASGSTGVLNGTAALEAATGHLNGTVPSGQDKPPRKHHRLNKAELKCILM
jgi:hypothetical protein